MTYKAISDYGAIGNLRTVALIAQDGSLDWLPFTDLDHPSVFGALLDAGRGGHFTVQAAPLGRCKQSYLEGTNVLRTVQESNGGRLTLTDFMPLRGDINGCNSSETEPAVYRLLECEGGEVEVMVSWCPRFDYARAETLIEQAGELFIATGDGATLSLSGIPQEAEAQIVADDYGPCLQARFTMRGGERRALVTHWGEGATFVPYDQAAAWLRDTVCCWRDWVYKGEQTAARDWASPWQSLILRSELVLKLLTFADTGAMAAAPTTSLPEEIGGVRNWDYRYTWIRDAAMSTQGLFAMGHQAEARDFISFANRTAKKKGDEGWMLRLMYSLRGECDLPEYELEHFEGYRGSRPVHVGNGAYDQIQHDIYGELLSAAYEILRHDETLEADVFAFLPHVADIACRTWRDPDAGIWEVRGGPHQFVYSKMMVWMALNRAVKMAESYGMEGDVARWRKTQDEVRDWVLKEGYNEEVGAFVQHTGTRDLDAVSLLFPLMEFLPFDDPRVQSTIDRTLEQLTVNDLVYRYRTDDGLPGEEGTFNLCTFWMIDALTLSGRMAEAERMFDNIVGRANHLGLFSEQLDPHNGAFLGNFPQAFTHVGLINSTLYLAYVNGRKLPISAPIGTKEHRQLIGNL